MGEDKPRTARCAGGGPCASPPKTKTGAAVTTAAPVSFAILAATQPFRKSRTALQNALCCS